MSNYYDAQVAVRNAWKVIHGKYPMDDPDLEIWQRESDRHLQMVLNLTEKLNRLTTAIEELDRRMREDETFMTVTEGDEEIIKFYNIPCGPWHNILGLARG